VLGRVLAQLLFGVGPADVATIAAATATLAVIAVGAGWAPAFRASRVDPMRALRYE
jgi:ABC-type lipoprotein release transport system permease subunit